MWKTTVKIEHLAREVDKLDTIPDREFMGIFMRASYNIDLEGAYTPEEVNRRIRAAVEGLRVLGERGYMNEKTANRKSTSLAKLVTADFGTRVVSEARRHPDGIVSLTLRHGRERAIDMRLKIGRRLREMTRIRKPKFARR